MGNEDDDLRFVATASDDVQQALIAGRLSEAAIHCVSSRQRNRAGAGGPCDVYVRAADLERARAVLEEDEGDFDETELARLSEEAGRRYSVER